ncbi:selenocysteine-specific translation elongation factor [Tissierella creatinini]|nr:selenocysteine-specific translation elongation factor [Tissierella creatinini]TJX67199.1 selenocysteine-specific translation elongation factor [Soehngenia saccharolytica]
MKHIIIGTAGHIDHGKTTLIRALTGRNTDRLAEEQKRGISIELGFTYFDLPSGQRAGIIDVPGHEKFIKNMLAGVIGIDIVLLVVAADEGIMPQTVEHLAILDILGIKKGIVVLTKTDLVDEEWSELIEEDVRKAIKGTFIENSPIIKVSSTKKTGIDELINTIETYSKDLEEKNENDMPRLPIDRVFTISGFGTVVTGTLLAGKLETGDEVQIYPGDLKARIRTLQVHDENAPVAYGGQRVAINLAGVKKEDIHRGSVVAPVKSMMDTSLMDVKIKLIKSIDKTINNRTRLHLYIGTEEVLCRVVLLDRDELLPGEETFAQLRLEENIVAKRGDRFILRYYSPMFTIGGGVILEPNASKKKRFDENVIEELEVKESGSTTDILEKIILADELSSIKDISVKTSMLVENIERDVKVLVEEGKVLLFNATKESYPIHINQYRKLIDKTLKEIGSYHERFPLRPGISKEEIRSKVLNKVKPRIADMIIQSFIDAEEIMQEGDMLRLKDFVPYYTPEKQVLKNNIISKLKINEYISPKKEEFSNNSDEVDEVISALISSGEIVRINDEIFLLKSSFDKALEKLKKHILANGSITIGEYRDLLQTNRKVGLGLLEYFDGLKITKRDGEKRTLI